MDVKEEKLCRFCLKSGELEALVESVEEIFGALLLNINFSVSEQPAICKNCDESLRKSFEFKADYMSVEDRIASFVTDKDGIVVDLKDIHPSGTVDYTLYSVCRFCLQCARNDVCVSLEVLKNDTALARGTLAIYIPEMDLTATEAPVICPSCLKSLQGYISFRTTCWDTEEKIKEYCKIFAMKCKVSLSDVVIFFSENTVDCDDEFKYKGDDLYDGGDVSQLIRLKEEDDVRVPEYNVKEEIEMGLEQSNCESSTDANFSPPDNGQDPAALASALKIFKCEICVYETKYAPHLLRHLLTHKLYKCRICSFETKHKYNLRRHFQTHTESKEEDFVITYKCDICSYETQSKSDLDAHMVTHKDSKDAAYYECNLCTFKTNRKFNYKRHAYTHMPVADRPMFVCKVCAFSTKEGGVLNKHMLTHKSETELLLYQCDQCPYEATRKFHLKRHKLTHNEQSAEKEYACALCDFTTSHKYSLSRHRESHLPTDVPRTDTKKYKCRCCPYETKRLFHLNRHMLTHRDPSEITMYKCELCDYQTKQKFHLTRHSKVHRRSSDDGPVPIYECDLCHYVTKQKSHITRHKKVHHNE